MTSKKNAFMRYGSLVVVVCVLCVSFVFAESGQVDAAPLAAGLSLPDTSVHELSAAASAVPSLAITQIMYYNRTHAMNVVTGTLPVKGGSMVIKSRDILTFRVKGRYTGPAGTYAMLDLFNPGTYPMNGVKRVDSAVIVPAGTTGTLYSSPYWFNGNTGGNTVVVEFWGNQTNKSARLNIQVVA